MTTLPSPADILSAFDEMILSASGWRAVFAASGDENDARPEITDTYRVLAALMADSFAGYIRAKPAAASEAPVILLGIDARPTGDAIADAMLRVLAGRGMRVEYLGIVAAPEIMALSRQKDGFVYISASHNPIGHNGVKFGTNDGGVISGAENAKLVTAFRENCARPDAVKTAFALIEACSEEKITAIYSAAPAHKKEAFDAYYQFSRHVAADSDNTAKQDVFFERLRGGISQKPVTIIVDMNGSARTLSIDKEYFEALGCTFRAINDKPREIAHGIIPEGENLSFVAAELEKTANAMVSTGRRDILLGYMPDCDGDRGNIVYYNEKTNHVEILGAQEVFALSVLAELSWLSDAGNNSGKQAVAVNCPTSMRIDEIAERFGAKVFRAEVGEANVVNLAREKRREGYTVRILGEGSNGGNITHPSAVRDPLNTMTALLKLLVLHKDMSLADIIGTLPVYTTTGSTEKRALLTIKTKDHAALKRHFQKAFGRWRETHKGELRFSYGIASYTALATNGTREIEGITDYGVSGTGGLKIRFEGVEGKPLAYMWMRGSGTEPVFRIACDVKGDNPQFEAFLLEAETGMLREADG